MIFPDEEQWKVQKPQDKADNLRLIGILSIELMIVDGEG